MATKGTNKKTSAKKQADDEQKAAMRFVDQPGQWVDTTPSSVKDRQAKAFKKLEQSMKAGKKATKPAKKK